MNNLIDVFDSFGDENETGICFIEHYGIEKFRTYSEIHSEILKMAYFLQKEADFRIKRGSYILFQIESVELFVYSFWACLLLECIPIPIAKVNNKNSAKRLNNIIKSICVECILMDGTSSEVDVKVIDRKRDCLIINISNYYEAKEVDIKNTICNISDTVFIQFSSGSTGNPKGIILTHENIISNIKSISNSIGLSKKDKGLSWLPLTHDMGLIGFHLVPSYNRVNHVLIATKVFVSNPFSWLMYTEKLQATITCSPEFGYKLLLRILENRKMPVTDLSCVRLIFNGAEPIFLNTIEKFVENMKPFKLNSKVIFPVYGLAEGTLAVSFPRCNTEIRSASIDKKSIQLGNKVKYLEDGFKIICEGKTVDGVEAVILDASGIALDEEVVGRIYIYGANVTKSILIDGLLKDTSSGLFTGDLGFIKDDSLYIIGRENEIIVNGKNFFCYDAEEVLYDILEKKFRFIILPVTVKEETVAVVFVKGNYNLDIVSQLKKLRSTVYEQTKILYNGIVFINDIPKTTSGKIIRYKVVENYNEGKYGQPLCIKESANEECYSKTEIEILDLFEQVYGERPAINNDVTYLFSESIQNTMFLATLETYYHLNLNLQYFNDVTTISDVVRIIENVSKVSIQ